MGNPKIRNLILIVLKEAKASGEGALTKDEITDRVNRKLRREKLKKLRQERLH